MKKILAIVLALAMVIVPMTFSVSADAAATITAGADTNVAAGDAISIPVSISGDVAGAQFDIALGDLENVTCTADAESFVYTAETNTIKFVDADLDGMTDLFTINATIPETAVAGDVFTASFANIIVCDIDEALIDTAVVAGKYTVASSHTHNYTAAVTTQPTVEAEGVMTYTCECGDSYTAPIARPTAATVTTTQDLIIGSVVGFKYGISKKTVTNAGYADYFIVLDYQKYNAAYNLEAKSATFTEADRTSGTANASYFEIYDMALYEMTVDMQFTVYLVNADGVVTGYKRETTSIAKASLNYANKYSTNAKLLTALADMMNYGDAIQDYFAATHAGSDLASAVKPSTVLAAYMSYASSTAGMPSTFNNEKTATKNNAATKFVLSAPSFVIASNNQIKYTMRADDLDLSKVSVVVSYTDSLKGTQQTVINDLSAYFSRTNSSGKAIYEYNYAELGLYDVDKTVTIEMKYNGVTEYTYTYSLGNFVNANISSANMGSMLTAMELFSNSMGIQLGVPARW